jgi:hypothetical protein
LLFSEKVKVRFMHELNMVRYSMNPFPIERFPFLPELLHMFYRRMTHTSKGAIWKIPMASNAQFQRRNCCGLAFSHTPMAKITLYSSFFNMNRMREFYWLLHLTRNETKNGDRG